MRESKKKNFQTNSGSVSNNYETDTKTEDLVLAESTFLTEEKPIEATDKDIENSVVLPNGVTSIDFMMPEEERKILEKNLNVYSDLEKAQKLLNQAKQNKSISEDLRTLELIGKTGKLSEKIFDLMTDDRNLEVLEQYIRRKFGEGDIAKAYKEVGLLNKAMLDARQEMIKNMKAGKSGSKARIALKFTNDSGEDFQLGAEIHT